MVLFELFSHFSRQKRFFTSISKFFLSDVLGSIQSQHRVEESLNRVLYHGKRYFKESDNQSPNPFIAQISSRISQRMTSTDLQTQALEAWNSAGGMSGIAERITFPSCDTNGIPSEPEIFLFGRKTQSSKELIPIIPNYLRVLNDMSNNKISQGRYDGGSVYGPTEAEHGVQAFLNALWILNFFNKPSLSKLQLALSAYWHDFARLTHSEESQGREEGHQQHHTQGKILLHIFGRKIYFFAELHTLAKILLCDLYPSYHSSILSTESLNSFSVQVAPALLEEYRQILNEYDDPLFYSVIAVFFRFFCDECAKPGARICPSNRYPIQLMQHTQLLWLGLQLHIHECLRQGKTESDIITNLLRQISEATQLLKRYRIEELSNNPQLYEDLYQSISLLQWDDNAWYSPHF